MNKRTLVSIIVIVLLAAGGGYALWQQQGAPDFIDTISRNGDNDSATEDATEEPTPGRITEDQVVDDDSSGGTPTEPGNTTQDDTSDETTSDQPAPEKPEVTRAEQSNDNIRVSAIFNKQSNGKCTLRLKKSGYNDVTRTVDIVTGPSYYACDGFRIPVSELPAKGTWQATVTHELNGRSATSDTHSIKVE